MSQALSWAPRMTVSQSIAAPLLIQGVYKANEKDKIQKKVDEMMDRVGLAKRFGKMEEGLQSILEAARLIEEANIRCGGSPMIKEQARRIAKVAGALCDEE